MKDESFKKEYDALGPEYEIISSLIDARKTCNVIQKQLIKTKKIKKIPDANYNNYLNSAEAKKIRNASLATIREMLKNDEW